MKTKLQKNNLPETWCVQNNGSELFKALVIGYLNKNYDSNVTGDKIGAFYGVRNHKDLLSSEKITASDLHYDFKLNSTDATLTFKNIFTIDVFATLANVNLETAHKKQIKQKIAGIQKQIKTHQKEIEELKKQL